MAHVDPYGAPATTRAQSEQVWGQSDSRNRFRRGPSWRIPSVVALGVDGARNVGPLALALQSLTGPCGWRTSETTLDAMNSKGASPTVPPGALVEFICADPPPEMESKPHRSELRRPAELSNCHDFAAVVDHFVRLGKTKTEAVRAAIEAAPELYRNYRGTGGPV